MKKQIIKLNTTIVSAVGVVGKTEAEGPLGDKFDLRENDDLLGCDTWEKAESEFQRRAFGLVLNKSHLRAEDVDAVFAGDLQNQCVGSGYGLLEYDIPYFGLYGACSTSVEGILLASILTSNSVCKYAAAVTSSHFCASERQYRTPLEYGGQRTPTAQRTVTGAGAFILGEGGSVRVTEGMAGIVVEKGVTDTANMGAAMAPAALSTLVRYFAQSGRSVDDFDLILTGDLGYEGSEILRDLAAVEGLELRRKHDDCGLMIYDRERQDVHAGGSGCGCSAVVLACDVIPRLEHGELSRVLFVATGAMMSPTSIQQGLAIPGVAHLITIEGNSLWKP